MAGGERIRVKMASDAALLSLIITTTADRWAFTFWPLGWPLEFSFDDLTSEDRRTSLCKIAGVSVHALDDCIVKLRAARVLIDGGISELADKLCSQACKLARLAQERK